MIAFLDVDYRPDGSAVAACVTAQGFADAAPAGEYVAAIAETEAYVPGQFYRRELPCLLSVLATLPAPPTVCVVAGYVWLGDTDTPGLGAHLFAALGGGVAVVGVAKTRFANAAPHKGNEVSPAVAEVLRGESSSPLHVSAVGIALDDAADAVRAMHGAFRLPTLLKRVDALCRQK